MRYRFGEFELDATSFALTRDGAAVKVWPKVFDVLRYMVEHRGRLVTKQELLDALWPDSHVDEVAVPWTISHARRVLGQASGDKSPIETVHGRGYRFTADVEELAPEAARASVDATPIASELTSDLTGDHESPFVGRDDAMRQLQSRLLDAKRSKGGACLLVGEAGIGKTRCVDELMAFAQAQGFDAWAGRSVEDNWAPVYWPWVQIVRHMVVARPALAARAEALLQRLGTIERDTESDDEKLTDEGNTFWWIDGVSRLLLDAARTRPLLVVLDDLHWADTATIDLLTFLAPDLRAAPVLMVASHRDVPGTLQARALKRLSRHADRIALSALTTDDVAAYVREVACSDALAPELCLAIHRVTAGNPLFLQQTVRTLVARHGVKDFASLSPAHVEPSGVARDVLGVALEVLEPTTRELLVLASVLGERFDLATLQQLSGSAIDDLLSGLESARSRGFVIAEEAVTYRFCHALMRSILYDAAPVDRRTQHHRRAAHILERSSPPRHAEVAHHYYASLALGDYVRVATAAHQAARVAARMQAFADASLFCDWARAALNLDTDRDPRAHAELLVFSAQMQFNAGQETDARTTIDRLIEIARPHRYFDLLVRAARILRHSHMMGALEDPVVRTMLEEALQYAPPGANELRINALSQLSWVPPYALEIERSKALSAEALDLAHRFDDERTLLRAINARLYALSGPDDVNAQLAAAAEMLERNVGNRGWATAAALSARYGAYLLRGDMQRAEQTCDEIGRIAHAGQWPAAIWYHERLVAQRRLQCGELEATAAALPELRERGRHLRVSYAGNVTDVLQGVAAIELRGARALLGGADPALFREHLATAPSSVRPILARLLLALDDVTTARLVFDQLATDGFANVTKDISYLSALSNLALLAVQLGDGDNAARLYEMLLPYAHFNTPNALQLCEGSVAHFLGVLAVFLKRDDQVATHFDHAITMNEALGLQPQLARTCTEYARWLFTRDDTSQRNEARTLHARARTIAQTTGMHGLLAQLDSGG